MNYMIDMVTMRNVGFGYLTKSNTSFGVQILFLLDRIVMIKKSSIHFEWEY
jgi:hypothetical protein